MAFITMYETSKLIVWEKKSLKLIKGNPNTCTCCGALVKKTFIVRNSKNKMYSKSFLELL